MHYVQSILYFIKLFYKYNFNCLFHLVGVPLLLATQVIFNFFSVKYSDYLPELTMKNKYLFIIKICFFVIRHMTEQSCIFISSSIIFTENKNNFTSIESLSVSNLHHSEGPEFRAQGVLSRLWLCLVIRCY